MSVDNAYETTRHSIRGSSSRGRLAGSLPCEKAKRCVIKSEDISRSIPQSEYELSIVMPCLNEAETIGTCVEKAMAFFRRAGVVGEVVVADNGSVDGSQELAAERGARIVEVQDKGYGSALMGGITASRGRFIIMGDADDSYDFSDLTPFLRELQERIRPRDG